MDLVSVIIPSFNRFVFLLNALESVKNQTYTNIEIIVINDNSDDENYYSYNWKDNNVKIIHLEKNSKKIFGYGCVGYVRNIGLKQSNGKWIAFCDDDDIWFPEKIEIQIKAMKENNCKMSSTDALWGKGIYDSNKTYKKFNKEKFFKTLQNIYLKNNSNLLLNGFPKIWNNDFIKIHNCIICSSVIIDKEILNKINGMTHKRRGQDYQCWKKAIKYTDSIYIDKPLIYYDDKHGNGKNH